MPLRSKPDLSGQVVVVTGDTGSIGAVVKYLGWLVMRSPRGGARTSVLLASSARPRIAGSTGGYWSHGLRWPPPGRARDPEETAWLWDETERLIAAAS